MATVIKNIPFVGGNTATFEFDFGTKVGGSSAECPLKLYWSYTNVLKTPSDITGDSSTGFKEYIWQAVFDNLKSPDGQSASFKSTDSYPNTSGLVAQMLIELDLNPLCNSLFGGSNGAMAQACTNIITDVYARGSGSNNGVQTNGVQVKRWYDPSKGWDSAGASANGTPNTLDMWSQDNRVDGTKWGFIYNNKFYLLLWATYPSDGTIPSEVDLDYIKITLQFTRVPDVIAPIPITLPDTWSILIKGFSPSWDSSSLSTSKTLLSIGDSGVKDTFCNYGIVLNNNNWQYIWGSPNKNVVWSSSPGKKFQVVKTLLEQTNSGMRIRELFNTGVVSKHIVSDIFLLKGLYNLYLGYQFNGLQADAFLNSLIFLPNKTFDDDTEAESILRGTADGFEDDELVTDGTFQNGLTSYPDHGVGITTSSNGITFTATGSWANQVINVLPNNQYYIKSTRTCACIIEEFYNNIKLNAISVSDQAFTVSSKTNKVRISLYPTAINQYCSSVSLKLKM